MAGSQFHLLFWVVLGAAATGGKAFSQRLSSEEIQEESATSRKVLNLHGVQAEDVAESLDSSGLDTLPPIGQADEYEVDEEDDVHGTSLYMTSSNETARHRSKRGTEDKFYEYAQRWAGTRKAKYTVCPNPPDKSKVKELHVYDCCYFDKGLKLQQRVGEQVWDKVVSRSTNDKKIYKFVHDNHGTTEDEAEFSREKTIQETNSWTVSNGVTTGIGISASLGFPELLGFGMELNFNVDISSSSEKTTTKYTQETIKVAQRFKVPPGKRLEVDWVITEETVSMKWHVDVFLKGAIGVYWDPDRKWLKNRNPKICGKYDYAIRVYELADGINWHQHGSELKFRRDGVFVGAKATSNQLIRRECDVNRPQDCARARTTNVVYTSPIEGDVKVLPANTGP